MSDQAGTNQSSYSELQTELQKLHEKVGSIDIQLPRFTRGITGLENTVSELGSNITAINKEISDRFSSIKEDIAETNSSLKEDIKKTNSDLKEDIAETNSALREDIKRRSSALKEDIAETNSALRDIDKKSDARLQSIQTLFVIATGAFTASQVSVNTFSSGPVNDFVALINEDAVYSCRKTLDVKPESCALVSTFDFFFHITVGIAISILIGAAIGVRSNPIKVNK